MSLATIIIFKANAQVQIIDYALLLFLVLLLLMYDKIRKKQFPNTELFLYFQTHLGIVSLAQKNYNMYIR